MSKKNYVKCKYCANKYEDPDHNAYENPCHLCKNSGIVPDPKEILCNLCGEYMCPLGTYSEQVPHGLYDAKVMGGYESYHLFDTTTYIFSFCEKCLRNLFVQCKIKPIIYDTDIVNGTYSREEIWEEDQAAYEYRLWYDTGGHHQAYINGKCNCVKDCPNDAIYTVLLSKDFSEDAVCEEHAPKYNKTINATLVKFIPNILKAFL